MPKLSKKSAARIATLINRIDAADLMLDARDEVTGKRLYDFNLWMRDRCLAIVALTDEFGIGHVLYKGALGWLEGNPQAEEYAVKYGS